MAYFYLFVLLVAVGFTNGVLKILNAQTLEQMQTFRFSKECITDIVFSPNSDYFATSDAERCVGIYRWTYRDEMPSKVIIEWVYLGRYRAHSKAVTGFFLFAWFTCVMKCQS